MELQPRDVQTQLKHKILERYLGAWTGIILSGLHGMGRPNSTRAHLIYIDCFAHVGVYSGNVETNLLGKSTVLIPGSPIIGIRALDTAAKRASSQYQNVQVTVNAVLIERDPKKYACLLENLRSEGYDSRLQEGTNFQGLGPSEIAVVNADCVDILSNMLRFTDRPHTWAFYLLDPHGAAGIPHDFVSEIVNRRHHDAMINFMYFDLHRKTGAILGGKTPSTQQLPHIRNWTNAFGTDNWIQLANDVSDIKAPRTYISNNLKLKEDEVRADPFLAELWESQALNDTQRKELTEWVLVRLYERVLRAMDPRSDFVAKLTQLHFPDRETTMFYLFLTTHDGTGALRLNAILREAEFQEHDLRYIRRMACRISSKVPSQPFLFAPEVPVPPTRQAPARPDLEECADAIMLLAADKHLTLREVYAKMADDIYNDVEVKKGVERLARMGKANYTGRLTNKTGIQFGPGP